MKSKIRISFKQTKAMRILDSSFALAIPELLSKAPEAKRMPARSRNLAGGVPTWK
jgi:hypothetical protein